MATQTPTIETGAPQAPLTTEQLLAMLGTIEAQRSTLVTSLMTSREEILGKLKAHDEVRMTLSRELEEVDSKLHALGMKPPAPPKASTLEKFCPICNVSGHDRRAHRGQPVVRPFTVQELSNLSK